MKVLSLFSGVGGFDMGLENAGMETVFQCEWDKHCRTILNRHWPDVPKWDDVSTLTGEHILAHAPVIDVVAWGSPCQDLSVAGKRAGLTGERSGLFHEGIRIIKELRSLTNGQYPRISIWENVAGALSSNNGADFGQILYEMDEAGACFSEWRVLDAQYFGVPQRRRRVFVVAVFDSATANRCPDPLLPVSEGLRWNPKTRTATRQSSADTASASIGSGSEWWDGGQIANALTTTSNEQRMPDKDRLQAVVVVGTLTVSDLTKQVNNEIINKGLLQVVEPYASSSFAQYEQGVGTLRSNGGDLGGGSETLLLDGTRVNDVRVYESPVQTLKERMGTGGNNVPMLMFDTQFGSNANVFENQSPTLKASQAAPSVAYPIQDGRDIEKNQNGLGVAEEGAPSYTIDQTGAQAVAFATNQRSEVRELDDKAVALSAEPGTNQQTYVAIGIQGNVIGRQDHNGPAGKGHTDEGDPMFTLNTTDKHAVAFQYDGYNDTTNDVHHALRAGTKQSTGVLMFQDSEFGVKEYDTAGTLRAGRIPEHQMIGEVAATLRSDGDGGVPSSRGEHLVVAPTMVVRRLTPLECERLMGWPDDHTRYKADGTEQADTHRYKQCGNGVASPVAEWIGEQLINL